MSVIWAIGLITVAHFQEPGSPDSDKPRQLSIEVTTAESSADPIDVIPVTVKITNVSEETLKLALNRALPGFALVTYTDPDGIRHYGKQLGPLPSLPAFELELKPHEQIKSTLLQSFAFLNKSREFRLPKPGVWKIQAAIGTPAGKVAKSAEVNIEIKDSAIPKECRDLFGSEAWHRFVLNQVPLMEQLSAFDKFIQSDSQFSQKDIMAYLLGCHYMNESKFPNAIRAFNASLQSRRNVPRTRILMNVVQCHLGNRNNVDAVKCFDEIAASEIGKPSDEYEDLKKAIQSVRGQR